MSSSLVPWNAPSLALLRGLLAQTAPFTLQLEGTPITVRPQALPGAEWPDPAPLGLSESEHGPWPATLDVRAEWAGGAASLRIIPSVSTGPRYTGLMGLRVRTRSHRAVLWIGLPSCFEDAEGGAVQLVGVTALLKRGDNSERSAAFVEAVKRAQFQWLSGKKVSFGPIPQDAPSDDPAYARALQNLIAYCLLKLPFYTDDPRDIEGVHFAAASTVHNDESHLETITGTTHHGLMIPALQALESGLSAPSDLEAWIERTYGAQLTSGDRRIKPNGWILWQYNLRWALSYLKQRGDAENPARGTWRITDAGRERLASEGGRFDIAPFQTLRAKVAVAGVAPTASESATPTSEPPPATTIDWRAAFATLMPAALADQLASRLRPELGSSPTEPLSRNVVFVGPPGTGKTWVAEQVAFALTGERPSGEGSVRLVQFHPSYGYEDFVFGIRPVLTGDKARFRGVDGPFLEICDKASEDPERMYVLIIDEINRGDPARIFGELMYALEYRGREITLASGRDLTVPTNLVVLGTMNSVDRSVAMVDYALRRRFAFLRVDPQPTLIPQKHNTPASIAVAEALTRINRQICERGSPELQIGHSYFIGPGRELRALGDVANIWAVDVEPQLAELFYGRPGILDELRDAWQGGLAAAMQDLEREQADELEAAEDEP